jgi:hypothetical protein
MAIALMVSEQFIKDTTVIDENVDMKLLRDTIELCQEKYILPLVGTGIYNELVTQILAGSVDSDNTTLLDSYIQTALKWWVQYEGVDILTYKFTNKTIAKKNSENSQPIDMEEVRRLMEKWRTNAEMYSQRVTDYLQQNNTTFTLYDNPGSGSDTIYPKKNSYTTSIWLGGNDSCAGKSLEDRYEGTSNGCCD